jgi:hypothetical protein
MDLELRSQFCRSFERKDATQNFYITWSRVERIETLGKMKKNEVACRCHYFNNILEHHILKHQKKSKNLKKL